MGKGEIARYEQFLLFPQCFEKVWFLGASKCVIVWEWVKHRKKKFVFNEMENMRINFQTKSKTWYVNWRKTEVLKCSSLTHSHTMTPFNAPGKKPFENTVGKREIAHSEQFLLFPQCFLPVWITFCHSLQI